KFNSIDIDFNVVQFDKNKGRFEARHAGALHAKSENLLFMDDRIKVKNDYFTLLFDSKKEVIIPNVEEEAASNIISETIALIRKKLYKDLTGKFASFYINKSNFHYVPKGTTSLWVGRNIFLDAC